MFSCHCCGLKHILLQTLQRKYSLGSASQAQLQEGQLPCPLYGQLAKEVQGNASPPYAPVPSCTKKFRNGPHVHCYSLPKSQPVPEPRSTGKMGEQHFLGQPCSLWSATRSPRGRWSLKAQCSPHLGFRTGSCRRRRAGRAPAPRLSALAGPLPSSPCLGALPVATRLCPVFVHFFCSPHFASPERGSCSSVNTIFESSHAVWAQILALIYCCVHFTALKSREFKSPLNTTGDTRRPLFWSSPINGYKFESRQRGSRAGKD